MGGKGSGGRNKKSLGAHLLEGTFRTHRHADLATPSPPKGKPPRPKTLTGAARAEWNRMIARLHHSRTLSIVDDAVLYQYVCLYAETEGIRTDRAALTKLSADLMRVVEKKLRGEALVGAVTEIVKLQILRSKQLVQLRQGHMALRQYLVEFGMTPAARTRVDQQPEAEPESPLDRFTKPRRPF